MSVFPNPSNGIFTIQSDLLRENDAKVKMLDISGREVDFKQISAGEHQISIDMNGVNAGWYIVKILSGNKTSLAKVNVVK